MVEAALALAVSWRPGYETDFTWRTRFMKAKALPVTFVDQIKEQLTFLRDDDYTYSALHVYIAGVPEPWEFGPDDDFEFNEDSGFLIVRTGPTDKDNND